MLKIALCDDEKLFVNELKNKIESICTRNVIEYDIRTYNSGFAVIENLNKHDIIFLDIEMPYINGIETAKRINKLKTDVNIPYVVFVTSKENLVFDALKHLPYSFIRKSHIDEDIENCIISINKKIRDSAVRYPVKVGRNTIFLSTDEIVYIEKDKNYVVFHANGNEYRERSNIDEKFGDLSDSGFIRTHIGYLVNLKYIEEITNSEVVLLDGRIIPVSKSYKQLVKDIYFDWMVKRR